MVTVMFEVTNTFKVLGAFLEHIEILKYGFIVVVIIVFM